MTVLGQLVVTSPQGDVRIYPLEAGSLNIGRDSKNDIVLHDPKVSREHARLECSEKGFHLVDLNSRSGIWVRGARAGQTTLEEGDEVSIGDCVLRCQTTETAQEPTSDQQEYVCVEAGKELSIVETLLPGESTLTENGIEHSVYDTSLPRIVIHGQDLTREKRLSIKEVSIGRDPECTIFLNDRAASRIHAVLRQQGDGYLLVDMKSKNGTWVGDKKIGEYPLANGANFRIGGTHFIYKAAFKSEDLTLAGTARARDSIPRCPVVVIPGIMGSELWDGDNLVWPDIINFYRRPKRLIYPDKALEARGIVNHVIVIPNFIKLEAYSRLTEVLQEDLGYSPGEDLLEFPYDWRQDNRKSAERLKNAVDDWRRNVLGKDTKITILAHSMGSLVARYYIACLGGESAVERVILMGAPCFGSPHIVQALLFGPRLLPLGIGGQRFQETITTFPSCYQLIPTYECTFDPGGSPIDLYENDEWVNPKYRHLLKDAQEFHRELGDTLNVRTTCIFGYGMKTMTKICVDERGDSGWQKVRFLLDRAGDNRVHEKFSFLKNSDIHPVNQYHGALWTDKDVRMRLRIDLLN